MLGEGVFGVGGVNKIDRREKENLEDEIGWWAVGNGFVCQPIITIIYYLRYYPECKRPN